MGILEEYKWLRQEIEDWSRVRNQFILASLAATAAIVAVGFSFRSGWAFLAPLVVWVPCAYICAAERRSILTISGYIRVFIEPQLDGVRWETLLSKLQASQGLPGIRSLTQGVLILQIGIMILLFALAAIYLDLRSSWAPYSLALAMTAALTIRPFYEYARGMADREKILVLWQELKRGLVH